MTVQRATMWLTLAALALMAVVIVQLYLFRPATVGELANALRTERVNLNITNEWGEVMLVTTVNWTDAAGKSHSTEVTTIRDPEWDMKTYSERHLQEVEDFKDAVEAAGGTVT